MVGSALSLRAPPHVKTSNVLSGGGGGSGARGTRGADGRRVACLLRRLCVSVQHPADGCKFDVEVSFVQSIIPIKTCECDRFAAPQQREGRTRTSVSPPVGACSRRVRHATSYPARRPSAPTMAWPLQSTEAGQETTATNRQQHTDGRVARPSRGQVGRRRRSASTAQ